MTDEGPPAGNEREVKVPVIYANGVSVTLTNADIYLLLTLDGEFIQKIHLSFTSAKSLHKILGELVSKLEKVTGRKIMITDDVAVGISKLTQEDSGHDNS